MNIGPARAAIDFKIRAHAWRGSKKIPSQSDSSAACAEYGGEEAEEKASSPLRKSLPYRSPARLSAVIPSILGWTFSVFVCGGGVVYFNSAVCDYMFAPWTETPSPCWFILYFLRGFLSTGWRPDSRVYGKSAFPGRKSECNSPLLTWKPLKNPNVFFRLP